MSEDVRFSQHHDPAYHNNIELQKLIGSCLRKVQYPTIKDARTVIVKSFERQGVRLYFYWCKNCRSYHLTKLHPDLHPDAEERKLRKQSELNRIAKLERLAAKAERRLAFEPIIKACLELPGIPSRKQIKEAAGLNCDDANYIYREVIKRQ